MWLRRMSIGRCVCAINMHSFFRPLQFSPLPSQSFFVSLTMFERPLSWPGWRVIWGEKLLILLLEDMCVSGCRIGPFLRVKYAGCIEKFLCVHRLWVPLKAQLGSLCLLNFACLFFFFLIFSKKATIWVVFFGWSVTARDCRNQILLMMKLRIGSSNSLWCSEANFF